MDNFNVLFGKRSVKKAIGLFVCTIIQAVLILCFVNSTNINANAAAPYVPAREGEKLTTCFPDPTFAKYVYKIVLGRNGGENSYKNYTLSQMDILIIGVTNRINISNKPMLVDLTGIKSFKCLKYLNCRETRIRTLDVSNLICLYEIKCGNNACLTSINVKGCSSLKYLFCGKTYITSLDVSDINFHKVDCTGDVMLTSINIDGCFKKISLPKNAYYKFQVMRGEPSTESEDESDYCVEL